MIPFCRREKIQQRDVERIIKKKIKKQHAGRRGTAHLCASAAASSPRLSPTVRGTRTHQCPEIPELGLFSVEMMAGEEGGRRGAREGGSDSTQHSALLQCERGCTGRKLHLLHVAVGGVVLGGNTANAQERGREREREEGGVTRTGGG